MEIKEKTGVKMNGAFSGARGIFENVQKNVHPIR
jgi:hypothetical protein